MTPILSIKTLFRSPIRTLLTFVLLGALTFALFSRTAEYAIMTREMDAASRRYRGVGAVEAEAVSKDNSDDLYIYTDPRLEGKYDYGDTAEYINRYKPLTQEQVSALSKLPYVSSVSERYMTAGISDEYTRMLDNRLMRRVVFEATVSDLWLANTDEGAGMGVRQLNRLIVHDVKQLTDTVTQPSPLFLRSLFLDDIVRYEILAGPRLNPIWGSQGVSSYGYDSRMADFMTDYIFDDEFFDSLKPGSRYIFVAQAGIPSVVNNTWMEGAPTLGDFLTDRWCEPVQLIDGAPENYLETEEFAPVKKLIELTNADLRTFDVVYTDDMSAIMGFAEGSLTILDGRGLTKEDSGSGASACVISRILAEELGLWVGDRFTLKLGTELFEQFGNLGALAGTYERYSSATTPVTLEIVGIYRNVDTVKTQRDETNWSYSINTIFVPKSMLPLDEATLSGHEFSPAEVSFTIDNAWNNEHFVEESAPVLEDMGLTLIFYDAGWPEIQEAFRESGRLSLINIFVFAAAVVAATLFTVYLFISRKKKEYAIMRALGTTRKNSAKALFLPLTVVAAAAILIGTCASWIYTAQAVKDNGTLQLLDNYTVNTSISLWSAMGCVFGQLALTLLLTFVMLRSIGRQAPLALLREAAGRERETLGEASGRERGAPEAYDTGTHPLADNPQETVIIQSDPASPGDITTPLAGDAPHIALGIAPIQPPSPPDNEIPPTPAPLRKSSTLFTLSYIIKHTRRSTVKSALTLLLAAVLFASVGQLAYMRKSNADLIDNTEIVATFAGGLPISAMHNIINNSLVGKSYYERDITVGLNTQSADLAITNDIVRYTGEEPDIAYIDGYDASCMEEAGDILIAGRSIMEQLGLAPGDTVELSNWTTLRDIRTQLIIDHRGGYPEDTATDEEILEQYYDQIMSSIRRRKTEEYTIVGTLTTPSEEYDGILFTPGSRRSSWGLTVAEISPVDNMRAEVLREYGERVANSTGTINFVIDTSRLEEPIKTLRLLETLYPGALAAALLIGAFLCCLLILQLSKEAAIMRILGTTKRKTRAILSLERVFLSIAGVIVGAAALLIYNGAALFSISSQLGLYTALYIACILASAIICSALATRRSSLELLQTKE